MNVMQLTFCGCAVGLSTLASAEVYYGTYTPSQSDPVIESVSDPWIYQVRDQDAGASATTQDTSETAYALLNVFGTNFNRNTLYTEFVAPSSFSATHIQMGVSRSVVASDTLMALSVQRWNGAGWENLYTSFGGARIRAAGVPQDGEMYDLTVPFGNNPTGGPGGFSSTPATIDEGVRYRLVLSHSAGAIGGLSWHLSTTAADGGAVGADGMPGVGSDNSTYYSGFNTGNGTPIYGEPTHQFAFAFTDGDPVPAPGAMMLAPLGVIVGLRRRR